VSETSNGIIVDKLRGVRIRNRPDLISSRQAQRIEDGRYEKKEVDAILKCLKGGEGILELGGGLGYVSTAICMAVRTRRYDVVEANPNLIPVIKDTHALNGVASVNVHHCIATTDPSALEKGHVEFNIGTSFLGSSLNPIAKARSTVKVPAEPLQRFLDDNTPDVLIADIEGAEKGLFRDVRMPSLKIVMLELHPALIGLDGIKSVFDDLSAHGFGYDPNASSGVVVTYRRVEEGAKGGWMKKVVSSVVRARSHTP
jgi:FkbM family methyltransferase